MKETPSFWIALTAPSIEPSFIHPAWHEEQVIEIDAPTLPENKD